MDHLSTEGVGEGGDAISLDEAASVELSSSTLR